MPLNIYTGNRMEQLVAALAGVLEKPLASAFTPELIIMQSKGMQRWLSMELAGRFGVWANCRYPFPNAMVVQLCKLVMPDISVSAVFDPEVMTWKLFGLLPEFLPLEPFAPLRQYLADDRDGLKRFQLVRKIADTFDQYTLFRPELLQEWEQDAAAVERGEWQAMLWRALTVGSDEYHRGRLKQLYCSRMMEATAGDVRLPERISVFGISYLPNYHLDILAATAQATEVNLFLLSPTREYWADIVSSRAQARLSPEERSHRIEGNPLLASLGALGRDFSEMAVELSCLALRDEDYYVEPEGNSLLCRIQSDILNLTGAEEGRVQQLIGMGDNSLQIHSCHSPMREVEALYDTLLALLDSGAGLEPRDIVVMTPDIEGYAPYIATVFEGCQDLSRKLPYSIADRRLTSEGLIASALLQLLALPGSRLTVVQLLDLLTLPPVRLRFGIEDDDLPVIRGWLEETRVRWGMDEYDRSRLGLPAYRNNSWRAGLDRLLLGYAVSAGKDRLFNGKLPFDEMEGDQAQLLGRLADFVERIEQAVTDLTRSRPPVAWSLQFRSLLADFIAADETDSRELAAISEIVESITGLGELSGFSGDIGLSVIRSWLAVRLDQEEKGLGFMTGGVTFCAMLPMRSIPFKVVCLIGMNDGAFPRQSRPPGFDLIARHPRRGDRSLRDEDRYLFLEAILSSRHCLYISYVGQSIRDNSEIPPSVLVSELLDAVQRGFVPEDGSSVAARLVTKHRLQAFSSAYFTAGSPLFSYSSENCGALRESRRATGFRPFMDGPLAEPAAEWKEVPLQKLLRFMVHPARFFLENRLGIKISGGVDPLDEHEPFNLAGLDAYQLKQDLLERTLQGEDPARLLQRAHGCGILPPARHGDLLFAGHLRAAAAFAGTVRKATADRQPLPKLQFELELDGFRLTGQLDRIWPQAMLRYRCATMKAKDQIRAWIEHLALNALQTEGYPRETRLIMDGGAKLYKPVYEAEQILAVLLELYWQGLMKPLPFFPESAMAYAAKQAWDLNKARSKWEDGFERAGEGSDTAFKRCFGAVDPFDDAFERVAQQILQPMLQHQG